MPSLEKRVQAAYEAARERLGVHESVRSVAQTLGIGEDVIYNTLRLSPEAKYHIRSKRTGTVHSRHTITGNLALKLPGTEGWEPVPLNRRQAEAAKSLLERKWGFSMEIISCPSSLSN